MTNRNPPTGAVVGLGVPRDGFTFAEVASGGLGQCLADVRGDGQAPRRGGALDLVAKGPSDPDWRQYVAKPLRGHMYILAHGLVEPFSRRLEEHLEAIHDRVHKGAYDLGCGRGGFDFSPHRSTVRQRGRVPSVGVWQVSRQLSRLRGATSLCAIRLPRLAATRAWVLCSWY